MTDLIKILSALEEAREGSQELDADVAKAVGWHRVHHPARMVSDPECQEAPEEKPAWWEWVDARGIRQGRGEPPRYTTNFNDTLRLLDPIRAAHPHMTGNIDMRWNGERYDVEVEITVPSREFRGRTSGKNAEHRAMCIAALRARAMTPEGTEDDR